MQQFHIRSPPPSMEFYTDRLRRFYYDSFMGETTPTLPYLPDEIIHTILSYLPPGKLVDLCTISRIKPLAASFKSAGFMNLELLARNGLNELIKSSPDTLIVEDESISLYWECCTRKLIPESASTNTTTATSKDTSSHPAALIESFRPLPLQVKNLVFTHRLGPESIDLTKTIFSSDFMESVKTITFNEECLIYDSGLWGRGSGLRRKHGELIKQILSNRTITIKISRLSKNKREWLPLITKLETVVSHASNSEILISCPQDLVEYLLSNIYCQHVYSRLTIRVPRSSTRLSEEGIRDKARKLAPAIINSMRHHNGNLELWDMLGKYSEGQADFKKDFFMSELKSQVELASMESGALHPLNAQLPNGFDSWKDYFGTWFSMAETELPKATDQSLG